MIDTATDADIPVLADMLYALNAHHACAVPERFHTNGAPADIRAMLAEKMGQGARALLYKTEGVARGYLLWEPLDRPGTGLERPQRHAVLDHIYVVPIWRRRGVAQRLIAQFECDSAAQGCAGWVTRVHAFNTASAGLMRGAGAALAVETYAKTLGNP